MKKAFDAQAFLDASGVAKPPAKYGRGESIYTQGDVSDVVLYIQTGGVKLSVRSNLGRDAVVAILGPGDFFGEACLTGQVSRTNSASAITPSTVVAVARDEMAELLRRQNGVSDWFIRQMLGRNIRIEEDLIDQLFNSSEKRLARALLRLARYGGTSRPAGVVPTLSNETLAEMTGATPARVDGLLKRFTTLGYIDQKTRRRLTIDRSLLSVVLRD